MLARRVDVVMESMSTMMMMMPMEGRDMDERKEDVEERKEDVTQ